MANGQKWRNAAAFTGRIRPQHGPPETNCNNASTAMEYQFDIKDFGNEIATLIVAMWLDLGKSAVPYDPKGAFSWVSWSIYMCKFQSWTHSWCFWERTGNLAWLGSDSAAWEDSAQSEALQLFRMWNWLRERISGMYRPMLDGGLSEFVFVRPECFCHQHLPHVGG
jgi:hypothetical protein